MLKSRYRKVMLAIIAAVATAAATFAVSVGTASAAQWPVVKSGSAGIETETVQHLLNKAGHSLDVDGQFGAKTKSAVEAFQKKHDLGVDGVVGEESWPKLTVDIGPDDENDAVKAAQVQLNRMGKGLEVDGVFGEKTTKAIKEFKKENDLGDDAKMDDKVWKALITAKGKAGDYTLVIPKDAQPRSEYDDPHHDYAALDLAVPTGTHAFAVTSGTVTKVSGGSCGNGIKLKGNDGATYTYCHFDSHAVDNGSVSSGDLLGYTGNTGNSTGPHLHFAMEASGSSRCPQTFLTAIYDGNAPPSPGSLPTSGCSY